MNLASATGVCDYSPDVEGCSPEGRAAGRVADTYGSTQPSSLDAVEFLLISHPMSVVVCFPNLIILTFQIAYENCARNEIEPILSGSSFSRALTVAKCGLFICVASSRAIARRRPSRRCVSFSNEAISGGRAFKNGCAEPLDLGVPLLNSRITLLFCLGRWEFFDFKGRRDSLGRTLMGSEGSAARFSISNAVRFAGGTVRRILRSAVLVVGGAANIVRR